jgi:hypothetical protein
MVLKLEGVCIVVLVAPWGLTLSEAFAGLARLGALRCEWLGGSRRCWWIISEG